MEILSIADSSIIKFWAQVVTREMEEAAKICLKNTLLKTDTEIVKLW